MIDPDTILYATVDSLRQDVVAETMPYVHRLAKDGIWFEQMVSCAPATAASFTALMASRYYSDVDGVGLPSHEFTTLAEAVPQQYRCVGRSTNQFTSSYYNYGRGFDEFESPSDGLKFTIRRYLSEEDLLFKILEWGYHQYLRSTSGSSGGRGSFNTPCEVVNGQLLAGADSATPTFLWGHYMDPHHPYEPPAEYLPDAIDSRAYGQRISQELPGKVPDDRQEDLRRCRDLYHAECRYFDDSFSEFHGELPEDTLVILVGDHGELLGEHGRLGHPHEMWRELITVPCLIHHPELPSVSVTSQQTTLDLAPTILDLIGAAVPGSMRGEPIDIENPSAREIAYGTIETPEQVGFARTVEHKWVRHQSHRSTQADHGELLFETGGDETVPIGRENTGEHPDVVGALRERYEDTVATDSLATGRRFEDEQVRQHMADLGYLDQA